MLQWTAAILMPPASVIEAELAALAVGGSKVVEDDLVALRVGPDELVVVVVDERVGVVFQRHVLLGGGGPLEGLDVGGRADQIDRVLAVGLLEHGDLVVDPAVAHVLVAVGRAVNVHLPGGPLALVGPAPALGEGAAQAVRLEVRGVVIDGAVEIHDRVGRFAGGRAGGEAGHVRAEVLRRALGGGRLGAVGGEELPPAAHCRRGSRERRM